MDEEGAKPATTQKRPLLPDGELVELLWQEGGVVAQAHKRSSGGGDMQAAGSSGVTGEETAAWVPDCGGSGDALGMGRDLYSQLWHSFVNVNGHGGRGAAAVFALATPPPASRSDDVSSRLDEAGLSICGSNVVTAPALPAEDDDAPRPPPDARAGASSSGGSGSYPLFKRGRDELDSRSEEVDLEAVGETRPSKRAAAKRRTRAAEVHNLSERRRRDRINSKLRALQELVPHCNKTDKASILDDAIEYLKSLQLQVQAVASCSDHVDDYRDCADDVPRCSPADAADGHGLEHDMHACGTRPESAAQSNTLHEQSSAEPDATDHISIYECNQCSK